MKTEKEKMISGEMYDASDRELVLEREAGKRFCRLYNSTDDTKYEERKELLKGFLGKMGENIHIESEFRAEYGYNLEIDENFYSNYNCLILDVCPVKIGKNVKFGPGVHIYTATHPIDVAERNSGKEFGKPVTIGDNVWIGGRSVIVPGVTLGNNVVVGSGSVVTKNFGDNVVIAGNPAKIIKNL
nr:sugar O-acetyltransferase [uncultured Cetobacterium sp.]